MLTESRLMYVCKWAAKLGVWGSSSGRADSTSECMQRLTVLLPSGCHPGRQLDAPNLWSDMRHTRSPRKAYWAAMPPPSGVVSMYNIPLKYAPVIQHPPTVSIWARAELRLCDLLDVGCCVRPCSSEHAATCKFQP